MRTVSKKALLRVVVACDICSKKSIELERSPLPSCFIGVVDEFNNMVRGRGWAIKVYPDGRGEDWCPACVKSLTKYPIIPEWKE